MNDPSVDYRIGGGVSIISEIIREVCEAIWSSFKDKFFPPLTRDFLFDVAKGFELRANFPNCIEAIDGKHIRIIKPVDSATTFYNYKQYFSSLLLAFCDSNYKFVYVSVGIPEKASRFYNF